MSSPALRRARAIAVLAMMRPYARPEWTLHRGDLALSLSFRAEALPPEQRSCQRLRRALWNLLKHYQEDIVAVLAED